MNTSSHIGRSAMLLSLSSFVFMISGYVMSVWLGRYLGPEAYGNYGVVISLVSVINLLQYSGVPHAVSRFISASRSRGENIFAAGMVLQLLGSIFVSVIFYLLAGPLARILHDSDLIPYLQLASLIFFFYGIYTLYVGYYNGLHDFTMQARMVILYSVVRVLSIVTLSYYFHLTGAFLGFALAPLFATLSVIRVPKFSVTYTDMKKVISFSFPLLGLAFFSTLQQSMDIYFVKALIPSDVNTGYYTANQNISRIPLLVVGAIATILFPSISKSLSENDTGKTKRIIAKSLRYTLLFLFPLTALISSMSTQVVTLIYSNAYNSAGDSLSVLAVGLSFFAIFNLLIQIVSGAGKPLGSLLIAMIGVSITSVCSLLLIPHYQLSGAAIATTIGSFVSMVIALIVVYKQFRQLVSSVTVLRISLSSFIVYVIAQMIHPSVWMLLIVCPLLLLLYTGILIIMKEITKEDWYLIRSLLP